MPIFLLMAQVEMEGIKRFWVPADHVWELDIGHPAGEEVRTGVQVDPEAEEEVPNSRTTANVLIKFTGEKHPGYLKKVDCPAVKKELTAEDTKPVAIAAFECRGVEPKKWTPTGPYCVESEGGVVFKDVGFKNEDWCEYDEKNDISLMLGKEIKHEFVLYRG
mmetsp:Transcript_33998/g.74607  ORF Transcript_33998/g.74607 Transcript_33998/m.74607 type:complete len:162 (+) Transcript_33998:273-758(+)